MTCTSPQRAISQPVPATSPHKLAKIAGVLKLFQGGWALKGPADEHLRDGSKEIPFDILLFPKLCLAALADAVGIFSKPGRLSKILFHMPATYYECLLVLTDLTVIEELPDIRQLRSDDFKEILGGMTIALALGDAEKRRGPRRQDRRHLEDAPVAQLAIADLAAPPFHLEGGPLPSRTSVYFDNFTHQSGERRAFCYCRVDHGRPGRCRRYVFVKDHAGDLKRAAAWLFAWVAAGAADPGADHVRDVRPTDALINHFEMALA